MFCWDVKYWNVCSTCKAVCKKCKTGQSAWVCHFIASTNAFAKPTADNISTNLFLLLKPIVKVSINGIEVDGLVDSSSSGNNIHPVVVVKHCLSSNSLTQTEGLT